MKYDKIVKKLLEDFNVLPQTQYASNSGPDIGMTTGDMNNTFPSKMSKVTISLPSKKRVKKKAKKEKEDL